MANLFERLINLNLPENATPEDSKIAIHAFAGALNEYRRGKFTGPQVISAFDLTGPQTTEAVYLKDLIVAAPDKIEFMRVFKDWLYMGEEKLDPIVMVKANFVQRLEDEVADQGGTLP